MKNQSLLGIFYIVRLFFNSIHKLIFQYFIKYLKIVGILNKNHDILSLYSRHKK